MLRCLDTLIFIILNTRENVIAWIWNTCTWISSMWNLHLWVPWVSQMTYCYGYVFAIVHCVLFISISKILPKMFTQRDLIWGNDCKKWHISLSNLLYFQALRKTAWSCSKCEQGSCSKYEHEELYWKFLNFITRRVCFFFFCLGMTIMDNESTDIID